MINLLTLTIISSVSLCKAASSVHTKKLPRIGFIACANLECAPLSSRNEDEEAVRDLLSTVYWWKEDHISFAKEIAALACNIELLKRTRYKPYAGLDNPVVRAGHIAGRRAATGPASHLYNKSLFNERTRFHGKWMILEEVPKIEKNYLDLMKGPHAKDAKGVSDLIKLMFQWTRSPDVFSRYVAHYTFSPKEYRKHSDTSCPYTRAVLIANDLARKEMVSLMYWEVPSQESSRACIIS